VRSRSLTVVPLAALAAVLLAGCTFSVGVDTGPTVQPDELATVAVDKLEETTGTRPDIDCGTDPIPLEGDTSVTCLLTDPVAGLEFDVVLTFTEVVGVDYSIDIDVASVPNNPPAPTAAPGANVPVADIEALVITALTPYLDYVPEVRCDATEVEIVVGNTVDCLYSSAQGEVPAVVTITQFDPTTGAYFISVS
jgi:hypothetical protein